MNPPPLHASCVAHDGRAILLLGASGAGKSDLALRLIDRGWDLVADDYVVLEEKNGRLMASPPASIAGRIEVRGAGLVTLPFVSGVPVALALQLGETVERLPQPAQWRHGNLAMALLAINPFEASAPVKAEHMLRLHGLLLK